MDPEPQYKSCRQSTRSSAGTPRHPPTMPDRFPATASGGPTSSPRPSPAWTPRESPRRSWASAPPSLRCGHRSAPATSPPAALTIATMSARTASGRSGHAWTTTARSGSSAPPRAPTAPDSAPPPSESAVFPEENAGCSSALSSTRNRKPVVAMSYGRLFFGILCVQATHGLLLLLRYSGSARLTGA